MQNKSSNLKQIAAQAGCSVSTVSRILNNYPDFHINPDTRQKVLAIAKDADYTPNPVLRTIKAKKTSMVALLDYNFYSHAPVSVMKRRFVEEMQLAGYRVGTNFLSAGEQRHYYPDWNVDGVAFFDVCSAERLEKLDSSKIPYVSMNGVAGANGVSISPDEESGVKLALEHLLDLGHRRIAYASRANMGAEAVHNSVLERERRYAECMAREGLPFPPEHSNQTISATDFMKSAVMDFGATALLCYNQYMGIVMLQAAWRMGIEVPGRLSVVCFDDFHPAQYTIPPLTCVATPVEEMGSLSAQTLLKMMKGDDSLRGRSFKLPCRLVARESTAPPEGRAT